MPIFPPLFCIASSSSSDEEVSRPFRRRLSKERRKQLYMLGPFSNITSSETLFQYLCENSNAYNEKVLTLLSRQNETTNSYDEIHHIIPRSVGGPDDSWNLICVTFEEHKELHYLRYNVYGEVADLIAARSRDGTFSFTKEEKTAASKRGHETMRKLQIGFYDPKQQAEFGRRSSKVGKTAAREAAYIVQASKRNSVYLEIFQYPLVFSFVDGDFSIVVHADASYFQRTGQIQNFLLEYTPQQSKFFFLIQNEKSFTSNFNKVLRPLAKRFGHVLKNSRQSYKGWTVRFSDFDF